VLCARLLVESMERDAVSYVSHQKCRTLLWTKDAESKWDTMRTMDERLSGLSGTLSMVPELLRLGFFGASLAAAA
jgi:hypothetical protein